MTRSGCHAAALAAVLAQDHSSGSWQACARGRAFAFHAASGVADHDDPAGRMSGKGNPGHGGARGAGRQGGFADLHGEVRRGACTQRCGRPARREAHGWADPGGDDPDNEAAAGPQFDPGDGGCLPLHRTANRARQGRTQRHAQRHPSDARAREPG